MKSRFVLLVACLSAGVQACDGDSGDDCTECWCNPTYCSDGDSDADADGDTGSLTVTATAAGVEVNADINLDGESTGYQTPHTFPNLLVRTHSILLSFTGRLQAPSPAEVSVTTEGTDVNIVLHRDLVGEWNRESPPGETRHFTMEIRPPDALCPDTWVRVMSASPVNMICVEIDDSLSLCESRAIDCGRDTFVEGQILEDGRKIEYDDCRIDNPAICGHTVYVKSS